MGKLDKLKKAGQGLSTKEEMAKVEMAISTKSKLATYEHIGLDEIGTNPMNDYAEYDSEEDIEELAASIERQGLLHNIVLSKHGDNTLVLLSGSRRIRALRKLRADPGKNINGKFDTVMCKVYTGLTVREEAIFLDAANLETRGGAGGDEKMVRKVTKRYIDNLKAEYNISNQAAVAMAKKISAQSSRVIDRDLNIENDLIPALRQVYEDGAITKITATQLVRLTEDEQTRASESFGALRAQAELFGNNYDVLARELGEIWITVAFERDAEERERLKQEAMAYVGQKAELFRERAANKQHVSAAQKDRMAYLHKVDRLSKQIVSFSSKKAVAMIQAFDASAPQEEKIRTRLDELQRQIEELKRKLDG